MKAWRGWLAALAMAAAFPAVAQVDLTPFLKPDGYRDIKLSPTGAYYAATVPVADRTVLVIIRRSDQALTAKVSGTVNSDIDDFHWVNDDRVLVSMAERFSTLERPIPTGELHAINADGSGARTLMGHEQSNPLVQTVKFSGYVAGYLVDDLPDDDRNVLIAVQAYTNNPQTYIDRMDVYNGRRETVATAPVRRARFTTDNAGAVRFARGAGNDNVSKLYYRDGRGSDWRLINDEAQTSRVERALGFAADNRTAYLQIEQAEGPDVIVAMDTATGQRTELLRDASVDPYSIVHDARGTIPIGARYMKDRLVTRYFDEQSAPATLQRMLEQAIPAANVQFLSSSRDGLHLVAASTDRNPGDYLLFNEKTRAANRIMSRAESIDPARMGGVRAIELTARDGLKLHGYLTLPAKSEGKDLPTVVLPHGGPFGEFDEWGFDRDAQILAAAGYAVLQVNYRGSGNYGRAFELAGAQEWGGTMQDDITDATRWVIEQGIADRSRICIYGASYGAYAALMGVAREPDLYRCAVGYVGVYDLPVMHEDDADTARWMHTWANDWLGDPKVLATRSPNRIAERIKVPVFLAAGGKDERAPIKHSRMMEKALASAGTPVETLYYPTEGHGFYTEEHKREYQVRLLDFLARHLGGAKAM